MKHKEIVTFNFNGNTLNVIEDDNGVPWFIAKQVSDILEYSDSHKMTVRLDEDEIANRRFGGLRNNREVVIINESGLYSAILGSNKPQAKAFKKWVTSEVLPEIRRTGGYSKAFLTDKPFSRVSTAKLSNLKSLSPKLALDYLSECGVDVTGIAIGVNNDNETRLLKIIKSKGIKGISKKEIIKLAQFLPTEARLKLLNELVASSSVYVDKVKLNGSQKPSTVYYWNK